MAQFDELIDHPLQQQRQIRKNFILPWQRQMPCHEFIFDPWGTLSLLGGIFNLATTNNNESKEKSMYCHELTFFSRSTHSLLESRFTLAANHNNKGKRRSNAWSRKQKENQWYESFVFHIIRHNEFVSSLTPPKWLTQKLVRLTAALRQPATMHLRPPPCLT